MKLKPGTQGFLIIRENVFAARMELQSQITRLLRIIDYVNSTNNR